MLTQSISAPHCPEGGSPIEGSPEQCGGCVGGSQAFPLESVQAASLLPHLLVFQIILSNKKTGVILWGVRVEAGAGEFFLGCGSYNEDYHSN